LLFVLGHGLITAAPITQAMKHFYENDNEVGALVISRNSYTRSFDLPNQRVRN